MTTSSPILGDFEYRDHFTVVPEPQSLLLLGLGVIGLTVRTRRRSLLDGKSSRLRV